MPKKKKSKAVKWLKSALCCTSKNAEKDGTYQLAEKPVKPDKPMPLSDIPQQPQQPQQEQQPQQQPQQEQQQQQQKPQQPQQQFSWVGTQLKLT